MPRAKPEAIRTLESRFPSKDWLNTWAQAGSGGEVRSWFSLGRQEHSRPTDGYGRDHWLLTAQFHVGVSQYPHL